MPLATKVHHSQFPATPFFATMPVTASGVSAAKVVATMEVPASHHGTFLPERKYSRVSRAAAEVKKFFAEEKVSLESAGLRVGVMPGGCSGFKYSLNIEDKAADDDVVIETGGVRCFVDGFSAPYLNGVTIDYHSDFQESGFSFENPNATGGCGCGTSFSV